MSEKLNPLVRWHLGFVKRREEIVKKYKLKTPEEITNFFRRSNLQEKEPDFCPLFKNNGKCHDIPDDQLICYYCACPFYDPFHYDKRKKEFGRCTINSKYGHRNKYGYWNCSACTLPHNEKFVMRYLKGKTKEVIMIPKKEWEESLKEAKLVVYALPELLEDFDRKYFETIRDSNYYTKQQINEALYMLQMFLHDKAGVYVSQIAKGINEGHFLVAEYPIYQKSKGARGLVELWDFSLAHLPVHRAKAVADVAAISYGRKKARHPEKLVQTLIDLGHESPFEFVSIYENGRRITLRETHNLPVSNNWPYIATFRVTVPIFVARQVMRHRLFSYMEMSRRYTKSNRVQWKFYIKFAEMRKVTKLAVQMYEKD